MNGAVRFSQGSKGEIWCFVRNDRVPVKEFLLSVPRHLLKRFQRMWHRFEEEGMMAANNNHKSFAPMTNGGRGLWSFKEHDTRIFATQVPSAAGGRARIAMLCGWVKDKTISVEEERQVARAMALRSECLALDWSNIVEWKMPQPSLPIEVAPPAAPVVAEPALAPEPPAPIAVEVPVPPEKEEEKPLAGPTTEKKEEYVRISALADLVEVHPDTIRRWLDRRELPPPTADLGGGPNGGVAWEWKMLDQLVEKAEALKASSRQLAKKAAAPKPEPPKEVPIRSRAELLAMAGDIIDGKRSPAEFLAEVDRRIKKIEELERVQEELRRLLGKE